MTSFIFDDYVRTTLSGARNVADGKPLTSKQTEQVIQYLKSPGSGPNSTSSYAEYLTQQMQTHPSKLPLEVNYIGFSGKGSFEAAVEYRGSLNGKAGIIGDTPWGVFIGTSPSNPEFIAIESKFSTFMKAQGLVPYRSDYASALQDIMWNAGSPQYFENAIAAQRPIVAFVDGAPKGRGFSNFELPTALEHPDAIINGYPVGTFKASGDPLAFVQKSAAEFQQLEKTVAQAATVHSGHPVSIEQVRSNLNLIEGYDAVNKTFVTLTRGLDYKADSVQGTTPNRCDKNSRLGMLAEMSSVATLGSTSAVEAFIPVNTASCAITCKEIESCL
jgi:hypothetical protein